MAIEQIHPRFESAILSAKPKQEQQEQKEILPFDKFVENISFEIIANLPFIQSWERALPQEDSAGADGFVKFYGLDNPIALDITVSEDPERMKAKLDRTGKIYEAKIKREDAKINPSKFVPIKVTTLFLKKSDFKKLYNQYVSSPQKADWRTSPTIQQTVLRELFSAIKRLYGEIYKANPRGGEREYQGLIKLWIEELKKINPAQ